MWALVRKEISSFFTSAIGYLVISVFLVLSGLFLWLFKGTYNIPDSGFASLRPFFLLAPWIFLFLIPAVSMRAIAEEKRMGTFLLLRAKPFSLPKLILGKYLGIQFLIVLAILPTLLYVLTIYQLADPIGAIDVGSTLGSYIALLLLSASYCAMGLFASALTSNQIVAFLTSVLLCFLFYFGIHSLAEYDILGETSYLARNIGMQLHYERISQGVLDTRDIFYFLFLIVFFLYATFIILSQQSDQKKSIRMGAAVVGLVLLNGFLSQFFTRFDLTQDQRFTTSEVTEEILNDIDVPLTIEILLKGDFPSQFIRLQQETEQLLETFRAQNTNINFEFIDPFEDPELRTQTLRELQRLGLTPVEVSVQEEGRTATDVAVPWAIASYKDRNVKIPLLKSTIGATDQDRVTNSVQQLEYNFADSFRRLLYPKQQKIAILKGNGQLEDRYIADFIKTLQEYYFVGAFTLDSVASNPKRTLEQLSTFDMFINAKPTEAFTEEEKYTLDQFVMQGKSSLWLTETVAIDTDSLMSPSQRALAYMNDLNLTDLYFAYGLRINPTLINDLYSAPIPLVTGQGNESRITPMPWFYTPLAQPGADHAIVNSIESVRMDFADQIDTLKNKVSKTVLLQSSKATKLEGVPKVISLDMVRKKPNVSEYTAGPQPLAVLLEGTFPSAYDNRVKPIDGLPVRNESTPAKMVVVADGDVIRNQVQKGVPLQLGFDRYTGITYGNKEFLLNTVNYLLDDTGIMSLRTKKITIPFLDIPKVVATRTFWQGLNVLGPLVLLGIFGLVFIIWRKRKYGRKYKNS